MSVSAEARTDDPIVLISCFTACEYGTPFTWEKSRDFEIGDIVYYIEGFYNENETLGHLKWKIKFKTDDGKIYAAIQTYFVTMDNWQDIEKYFMEKIKQNPGLQPTVL